MSRPFVAFKFKTSASALGQWTVLDSDLVPIPEVHLFLAGLRSVNTQRSYAAKCAYFLNWASTQLKPVDWKTLDLRQLSQYFRHLEDYKTPDGRSRSAVTTNLYLTSVTELLKFSAASGLISESVPARFFERKFVRRSLALGDGDRGAPAAIETRRIKAQVSKRKPKSLDERQMSDLFRECRNPRDLLLVVLLLDTGLRIGEALGLRRSDMHLLPDSSALGCPVRGSHLHVERRINLNGALAKSPDPREIPASDTLLDAYREYQYLRMQVVPDSASDFVFLNLFSPSGKFDSPMKYQNTYQWFARLCKRAGHQATLHGLRHTAATRWTRSGVDQDVIQSLLGHRDPASTAVYQHANDEDLRMAVLHTKEVFGW